MGSQEYMHRVGITKPGVVTDQMNPLPSASRQQHQQEGDEVAAALRGRDGIRQAAGRIVSTPVHHMLLVLPRAGDLRRAARWFDRPQSGQSSLAVGASHPVDGGSRAAQGCSNCPLGPPLGRQQDDGNVVEDICLLRPQPTCLEAVPFWCRQHPCWRRGPLLVMARAHAGTIVVQPVIEPEAFSAPT